MTNETTIMRNDASLDGCVAPPRGPTPGPVPRRLSLVLVVILVSVAAVFASSPLVHAQDATPAADTGEPEGITFDVLDLGTVEAFPAGAATVTLIRLRVEPGAGLTFPPEPGLGLHVVESGALTIRNFTADVVVTRAAPAGSDEPGTREILPAGEETTLEPGDSFVFPPVAGEWRNDGQETVVFTVVLIDPVGAATPAAPAPEATPAA
jgi:hypothetical protein